MNAGDSVQKSMNAEETAVLQNIAALVQQALTMESAEGEAPGQNGAEEGMNPGGVMKGTEQGRAPAEPQTVTSPGAAPKDKGMADWNDEEVKKAFATIAKSLQTSDTDGTTANDTADERIEEIPDADDENVKAVAKALLAAMGKKKVAKSATASGPDVTGEMMKVIKSLNAKVEAQGTVITEMLEGLGVAKSVEQNPANGVNTSVEKSANTPYANPTGANQLADVIGIAVAKALAAQNGVNQTASGIPVAKGFGNSYGHEDVRQFTEGFVGSAGDQWGNHALPQ